MLHVYDQWKWNIVEVMIAINQHVAGSWWSMEIKYCWIIINQYLTGSYYD